MTPEEKATLESVHRQALDVFGYCGAADLELRPVRPGGQPVGRLDGDRGVVRQETATHLRSH